MSHKPIDGRELENATPEQMREELDKYFAYVQQHDPKSIEFTLAVTGHKGEDDSTHICAMIGGPPQTLAHIIVELMDELVKRDPAFAVFFLLNFLQRMRSVDTKIVDLDNTGGADVEAQVNGLLDKLRNGSIH